MTRRTGRKVRRRSRFRTVRPFYFPSTPYDIFDPDEYEIDAVEEVEDWMISEVAKS